MIARLAQGVARHALVLRALAHKGEIALRAHLGFFLDALLGDRVECAFIGDQQVVIGNHVDAGDPRAVELGERNRRAHRSLRQIRTVGRYQDVLEHLPLLAPP